MDSAEKVLVFDGFFIFLLGLFGGQAQAGNTFQVFSSVQTPQFAPLPSGVGTNCGTFDLICQAGSVARATAYIGWAIINMPVLFIYFLSIFVNFANVVLNTVFSPSFSPNGVPVIGFFFIILQIIAIWGVFKVLRGVGGLAGSTL